MSADFLSQPLPLVAAPMAGGPTSPDLVIAAARAGALALLAAGYKTPAALADEIATVRAALAAAPGARGGFGVNLFVPADAAGSAPEVDRAAFAAYALELTAEAAAHDVVLDPVPHPDRDFWDEKLELLERDPVSVVTLTFTLPAASDIARLQRVGTAVLMTVTTAAEALAAVAAGVDGLVVQGPRAGGHSGTWDPQRQIDDRATTTGLAEIAAALAEHGAALPLIVGGGVAGPADVRELLQTGADAVAVGTLLLRATEAGTSESYRAALEQAASAADADGVAPSTVMTRAFTGRFARALRNGFIERHEEHAIVGYPEVHHLTRELRKRAAAAGDTDRLHLWAGTGVAATEARPAAEILSTLAM